MPREVVLYNPEYPGMANEFTYESMYEARKSAERDLKYKIRQFKSSTELEQQLKGVFVSHQTNPIDKVWLEAHGSISQVGQQSPEGVMVLHKYAGDFMGQMRNRDNAYETLTSTELAGLLKNIQSPTKIPQLRLVCCNGGLLSVEKSIARTLLRSDLFNYVVAEDMVSDKYVNFFRARVPLSKVHKFEPKVKYTPNPNAPTRLTETFLAYCAPGNDYRQTEKTVVYYHATNPMGNLPVERWDNYTVDLPFNDLSNHLGKKFPDSVTTPKEIRVRRFPCIPW